MRPVSSARGINSSGGINPRFGCCHRTDSYLVFFGRNTRARLRKQDGGLRLSDGAGTETSPAHSRDEVAGIGPDGRDAIAQLFRYFRDQIGVVGAGGLGGGGSEMGIIDGDAAGARAEEEQRDLAPAAFDAKELGGGRQQLRGAY